MEKKRTKGKGGNFRCCRHCGNCRCLEVNVRMYTKEGIPLVVSRPPGTPANRPAPPPLYPSAITSLRSASPPVRSSGPRLGPRSQKLAECRLRPPVCTC